MSIRAAMEWLAATHWSIALHESQYVWSFVEATHVLTLALFVGTTVMMDLRLLGVGMTRVPPSEFTSRMLPWTRAGFTIMVITGVILFTANPVAYYQSLFFRIKVILLAMAGLNVWHFHARTHPGIGAWDARVTPPRAARVAAVISLVAWSGVVVAGRLVAYNWFDCELGPQPVWVNRASGCVVPPSSP